MAKPDKIAIFRSGLLGDTLVVIPALKLIKQEIPNVHLTYVVNSLGPGKPSYARQILSPLGLVDNVLEYSNNGKIKTFCDGIAISARLRSEKLDYAIVLEEDHWNSRRSIFARMTGAKHVHTPSGAGIEFPKNDKGALLPVPRISDQLMSVVAKVFGFKNPAINLSLQIPASIRLKAAKWLSDNIPNKKTPILAVSIGSNMSSKRWGYYGEVLRALILEFKAFPVLFGSPGEYEMAEKILLFAGSGFNACGKLEIVEIAEVMKSCSFYLGNDSGLMHLASVIGLPCVALFSAHNSPGRWYPYGAGHDVFRKKVDCEGCAKRACDKTPRCIDLISIDEVLSACRGKLACKRGPK